MANQRETTLADIARHRLGAIIRTQDQQLAADGMQAAVRGGFRMVEFTMTTPGALELIREFSKQPDLIVGAGTVMTTEHVAQVVNAGARFIVSPIIDAEVIAAAADHDVVSIPGTYTPTEMVAAQRAGADMVKLFPGPANIAQYVRQIVGPLPELRIYPTAGVTAENFVEVLHAGAFGVGFVSSLFTPQDMANRNFDAIEQRAAGIFAQQF